MPISKLFDYPTDAYLKVRFDYLLICTQDELEAKVLRIIERYVEMERARLFQQKVNAGADPQETIEVQRDIPVPISHALFLHDLFDTVKSENTLKRALTSLLDKKYILMEEGKEKYEPNSYCLNVNVIDGEFASIKKMGIRAYQKLMVSKIDGIKNCDPHTDSGYQKLIPSRRLRVSKIDTNVIRDTDKKPTVKRGGEEHANPSPPVLPNPEEKIREDEIWCIVERETGQIFDAYHRGNKQNSVGMHLFVKNKVPDTAIATAIQNQTDEQRGKFNLQFLYDDLPGLLSKTMRKERGSTAGGQQQHRRVGSPTASAYSPPERNTPPEQTPEERAAVLERSRKVKEEMLAREAAREAVRLAS